MFNFYFVTSYNLTDPKVKKLTDKCKLNSHIVELKTKSKLYHSFAETLEAINGDFKDKIPDIYVGDPEIIKTVTLKNPLFAPDAEISPEILEVHGELIFDWDEDCCAATFFSDAEAEDESIPKDWMFKYEVKFSNDGIEYPTNGEYIFGQEESETSSYH